MAVFAGVSSILSTKSLTRAAADAKTSGGGMYGGWSSIMFSFTALFAIYSTVFLVSFLSVS